MGLELSEEEVAHLMLGLDGYSDREIAQRLGLSEVQVSDRRDYLAEKISLELCESIDDYKHLSMYEIYRRRRLESELWASEARINALMDVSPDAIVVVNGRSGIILKVNNRASILFEYAPSELVGSIVEMLIDPDVSSKHVFLRHGFLNSVRKRELGYHPPIIAYTGSGRQIVIDIALTATMATDDVMVVCRPSRLMSEDETRNGLERDRSI